ncbi:hypothetical protein [uncultured Roseobacter sp.]|nr:hypothetical protein [uncultured Roseobacter sp.]
MGMLFALVVAYTSDSSIARKFSAALYSSNSLRRFHLKRVLDALLEPV